MKAEVYAGKDGWRFRVTGDNGEIMAVGESYIRRIDAEHALQVLFSPGQSVDVTVRNHSNKVVEHYLLTSESATGLRNAPINDQPELPFTLQEDEDE